MPVELRGSPPARPKKPWGWVGLIVRTQMDITDPLFGARIDPGKLWVVSYSRGGLTLESPDAIARKVPVDAVEPVFAPTYRWPPQYPQALFSEKVDEAWAQYNWCLKQIEAAGD